MRIPLIVEKDNNLVITFWIVCISLALGFIVSWLLNILINLLPNSIQNFSFIVDIGSPLGIYYGLINLFEYRIWDSKISRLMCLVDYPNLTGKWTGILKSNYDIRKEYHIRLDVKQTWRSIKLHMIMDDSSSINKFGYLELDRDHYVLSYEFINSPEPYKKLANEWGEFNGYTTIDVSNDFLTMKGTYYSDYKRKSYGSFELKKELTSSH